MLNDPLLNPLRDVEPAVGSGENGRSFFTRTVKVTVPPHPFREPTPLELSGVFAPSPHAAQAGEDTNTKPPAIRPPTVVIPAHFSHI
ncbi:MAG: hypothetical protein ACRCYU_22640 [Nocardioides sp.]